MKRNILVFGAIAGSIVSVFMATSMAVAGCSAGADMTSGMVIGFASMAVAFSFVFVGIRNFRDKQNGGIISFGKAFVLGLMISLVASTMYVLTWAVEYNIFLPDFMDKYSALEAKKIQESGIGQAEMTKALANINDMKEKYKNPVFFTLFTYMEILPVGIIISLISSLILRRKTPKLREANA
jgi:hypothetical protein